VAHGQWKKPLDVGVIPNHVTLGLRLGRVVVTVRWGRAIPRDTGYVLAGLTVQFAGSAALAVVSVLPSAILVIYSIFLCFGDRHS